MSYPVRLCAITNMSKDCKTVMKKSSCQYLLRMYARQFFSEIFFSFWRNLLVWNILGLQIHKKSIFLNKYFLS